MATIVGGADPVEDWPVEVTPIPTTPPPCVNRGKAIVELGSPVSPFESSRNSLCQVARSGICGDRRGNCHVFNPAGKSSDGREIPLTRSEPTGRVTQRSAPSGNHDVVDRASSAIGLLGNNRVGGGIGDCA